MEDARGIVKVQSRKEVLISVGSWDGCPGFGDGMERRVEFPGEKVRSWEHRYKKKCSLARNTHPVFAEGGELDRGGPCSLG